MHQLSFSEAFPGSADRFGDIPQVESQLLSAGGVSGSGRMYLSRPNRHLHRIGIFALLMVTGLFFSATHADETPRATPKAGSLTDANQDPQPSVSDPGRKKVVSTDPAGFTELIVPDLGRHWKCYSADSKATMEEVWRVTENSGDPMLVCAGQPKGFLYSTETYSDFELTLEWRFPTDANGNSGVLVYLQDEPRIWPTSMQIQFHQPKAGSVFPSGDAKSANTSDADLAGPVNTWNTCRIVSKGGRLSVEVNGKKAGETTGAVPSNGAIALQSEGAEVHFRRIRIRRLAPDEPMPVPPPAEAPAKPSTSPVGSPPAIDT
ncbi:MAG: DUF1080 domain-containing protein [Planctomycetaceae bacterium]|nr:DUF1080 domain-containing protein [Planctomycetaceae bacterium]